MKAEVEPDWNSSHPEKGNVDGFMVNNDFFETVLVDGEPYEDQYGTDTTRLIPCTKIVEVDEWTVNLIKEDE